MALSKDEQALLDQMEAALAQEDPKLANALRGTTGRRLHRRRAALAGIGFLAGVACLVVGMVVRLPAISVVGFVLMLASTVVALSAWQRADGDEQEQPARPQQPAGPAAKQAGPDMMDKLEDRWRRRQQGDL